MDSSGLKMKKNGSITHCKMKVLEKDCKPTLNPAVLSYLKKQNESKKQSNLNNLCLTNHSPQIMEIGVDEILHPENVELTPATDENFNFHLSSISPPIISSFTEYENDQELLQAEDPGNNYYQLQTIIDHDKSPVWWRNEENSSLLNSSDCMLSLIN
ncbi:unnamed protein product [Brugia timori]|uniref:NAC domain-containing protein n=1 Tax=Brugia timori TaxID=42155 RepID=A0A0R3RCB3_9BILA|nr:unnamed protein product [Brugia timori]